MNTLKSDQISSAPPREPSGGVVALGIINIAYSSLFYILINLFALSKIIFPDVRLAGFHPSGGILVYSIMHNLIAAALGIALLIGGVGLLQFKRWGRTSSLGAATAIIIWSFTAFAINVFFVYPETVRMMGDQFPQGQQMVISVIAGVAGVFFQLVYPIILIICLHIRSIKNQFQPEGDSQQY